MLESSGVAETQKAPPVKVLEQRDANMCRRLNGRSERGRSSEQLPAPPSSPTPVYRWGSGWRGNPGQDEVFKGLDVLS